MSMVDTVTCPGCRTSFAGSPALRGKKVRCRHCRAEFRVPPPVIEDTGLVLLGDNGGLEFFDDEPAPGCGLEFYEEPDLTGLAPLGEEQLLSASRAAPTGLVETRYVPPVKPTVQFQPPELSRTNIFCLVLLVMGVPLLTLGWLLSVRGAIDGFCLGMMIVGGGFTGLAVLIKIDNVLIEKEWFQELRQFIFILYVILQVIALIVGIATRQL